MKALRAVQALAAALLLGGAGAQGANLVLGTAAPPLHATLLDSTQTVDFAGPSGHVRIVNFWATWCEPCKAEMPLLQAYYAQHRAQGLELLTISMDTPAALPQVRRLAQQYHFPIALQSQAQFNGLGRIWRLPTSFVIDAQGLLRKNGQEGDGPLTAEELERVVTPLLPAAGAPPR